MKLLFIGPQGSGKGTQASVISQKLNIPHISTGEILRNVKGDLKEQVDELINKGHFVSDELIMKIVKERVSQSDCKKGFILDGTPRNLSQSHLLKKITNIDKVVEIFLSDEEAIKRLAGRVSCEKCKAGYNLITQPKPKNPKICDVCGGKLIQRADDNEEAIKKRLQTYHQETEPILKEYKNILIKINGNQDINKIAEEILKKLNH